MVVRNTSESSRYGHSGGDGGRFTSSGHSQANCRSPLSILENVFGDKPSRREAPGESSARIWALMGGTANANIFEVEPDAFTEYPAATVRLAI